MYNNNLNENLETLFSKMEYFISSKTVVGEPFNIGEVIILPLVDVYFGVGAGTLDGKNEKNLKDKSAGGLGAKITPSAVIVIKDNTIQLVNIKNQDSINKLIDMVPSIVSKFNLDAIFSKKDKNSKEKNNKEENSK